MPKAYAVVTYRSVSDPQKLAAYAELALPAVKPFGARILARGNAMVAREHGRPARCSAVRRTNRPARFLHVQHDAPKSDGAVDALAVI